MSLSNACSAGNIPQPSLFGAEFLSISATPVSNQSISIPAGYYPNHGPVDATDISFCNVTISYTHPGQDDLINVQVWLPPASDWNQRLQAIGGGGWQTGLYPLGLMGMSGALAEGYATAATDAGLGTADSPEGWGLVSEGNVNLYLLEDFASVSLNDAAVIAKSVVASYYGQEAMYAYFNGCSQGGRQGYMLAQRYPDAYDGIAASAPAINWNQFGISELWPGFLMDRLGAFPPSCELDAITAAAVAACDADDGVVDGIISKPGECEFDPATLVGEVILNCTNFGTEWTITADAAEIVKGVWTGPKREDNSSIWYGVYPGTPLADPPPSIPLIRTTCTSNGTCTADPFPLVQSWVNIFLLQNSSMVQRNISHAEVDHLAHLSVQLYESIIGTNDPDLSDFKKTGGKLLSWHGMTDAIIPTEGTEDYYRKVMAGDEDVHDYFRMFLAPGVAHCFGGPGAFPDTTFDSLVNWVENGVAPDTLEATSIAPNPVFTRSLCPYPQEQVYDGVGNVTTAEGFTCV